MTARDPRYHAANGDITALKHFSPARVREWASDPNCIERAECAAYLETFEEKYKTELAQDAARLTARREELQQNPFDPRTEVSADAKHIAGKIVTNLWIIFVALPFVLAVLYAVLK